jgi:ABC-type siderophore export system fused ATPase/permease subunit
VFGLAPSCPARERPNILTCAQPGQVLTALHKQGSTIAMVAHEPRSADQADRQVSWFDGKIVDDRRVRAVPILQLADNKVESVL